jgi:hypothetical protein
MSLPTYFFAAAPGGADLDEKDVTITFKDADELRE